MRLLLINNNPAVSRLLRLSVDKAGYEMDEFEDYGLVPLKNYDVVMVDNELYDEEELSGLKEQVHCEYFLYICQRGAPKPDFVNVSLEKPFLPTDFLALLDKIKNVIASFKVADEPKEESLDDVEEIPESHGFEEIDTLDTHALDTLNIEDDMLSFDKEENKEEEDNVFEEIKDTETFEDSLPTFDLDAKDEELDFPFDPESVLNSGDKDLEPLNFEEIDENKEENIAEEELLMEEKVSPSILDKDDIDEVKQLLEESDEEESLDDLTLPSHEEMSDQEDEEEDSFKALISEEEPEEVSPEKNTEDEIESFSFEDTHSDEDVLAEEDAQEEEDTLVETQEEMIDDFAEEIEEKIEQEDNEKIFADILVEAENSSTIDSLDDLNENMLKKAFGEEVEEDILAEAPKQTNEEIEVIRGEIESSIARSISGFAQSDILREALKGMKINISITFDEKI